MAAGCRDARGSDVQVGRGGALAQVWCKPYKKEGYPPLLHDLRHSHSVNVFFPNADLMQQTIAAAMNIKEGSMLVRGHATRWAGGTE